MSANDGGMFNFVMSRILYNSVIFSFRFGRALQRYSLSKCLWCCWTQPISINTIIVINSNAMQIYPTIVSMRVSLYLYRKSFSTNMNDIVRIISSSTRQNSQLNACSHIDYSYMKYKM